MRPGKVFLVGAGPGDPDLLTVKAVRCLAQAHVVVYDRLIDTRVLDYATGRHIYVGKSRGWHSQEQDDINALLVAEARAGATVVRLKGGDPYVFGRGGEEYDAVVRAGLVCEVVPGVSSALAAPASVGIPATHRGLASQVTIVSGHADPDAGSINWRALAALDGTLVVLMGMASLHAIVRTLVFHGKSVDTPAAVVQYGTTVRQRVVSAPLLQLPDAVARSGIGAPAVIVIGAVAARAHSAMHDVLAHQQIA
jgi:uroporphyrin-III C-methyltransferase